MMEKYTRKLVGSKDERAVSPVIGVILMVAITVILAAVIAAFVLDIGPGDPDPSAAVSTTENSDENLELTLDSLDGNADAVVVVDNDDEGTFKEVDDGEDTALTVSGQSEEFDVDFDDKTVQAISVNDPDDLNTNEVEDLGDVEANAIVDNLDDL